jgi:hypothetical protein
MFRWRIACMTVASALLAAPPAWAAPSPAVQREISQLLSSLENSGCEFQRNGQWHDARAARAHVEAKYQYLLRRDLVQTTDDFIVNAATASSTGGGAYQVRCGNTVQPSADWLRAELARLRRQGGGAPKS